MIHIVTDSTADIPPQFVDELKISIVPCFIMFGDESFLDDVTITRPQFYARLATSPQLPTTAGPGAGLFEETYKRVVQPGDEIISIHVAADLSGICNSAQAAGQNVPETRVTVYDSRSTTMGLGWQVIAAARAAREGKSVGEIVTLLDRMKTRVYVFAALNTMEFLRRSGRVGWAKAFIGQVLNVKPIIRLYQSTVDLVDRVRTRSRALMRLVEMANSLGKLESLAVLHTAAPEAAAELVGSLAGFVPGSAIPVVEATPVLGVHVGPHALGLAAVINAE